MANQDTTGRIYFLMALRRDRLLELLAGAAECRIAVVGDVMLDRYLLGDTDRLSPEAPVPVVNVTQTRATLGGAANVASNVRAMGAECALVGVIGDDPSGASIRIELAGQGLSDARLLEVAGRPTTSKTRLVSRGQQIVRIDEEVERFLTGDDLARFEQMALDALSESDGLLLQDYNKGALPPPLIRTLIEAARKFGVPVVADPKFRQFFDYAGATVFKPNRRELEAALGARVDLGHREALPDAITQLNVDNLLLTLGGDGMILVTQDKEVTHIPSLTRGVSDVSGAGDTVTAWVGTMLAAGATIEEAAAVANYAANVEVTKPGVATVSVEEVLGVYDTRHDQIGRWRRGGVI
jgi:D-beta-D-heptose 7-phosphate kinase/D-beta-D-heptose 1-phosphate adenosyltransferase